MKKEEIQIFAVDLDLTLLNSNSEISDFDLLMLKELVKLGVKVIPVSGRKSIMIKNQFVSWDLKQKETFLIGAFGSEVFHVEKKSFLFIKSLSTNTIFQFIDYCEKKDMNLEFFLDSDDLTIAFTKKNDSHIRRMKVGQVKDELWDYSRVREYFKNRPETRLFISENQDVLQNQVYPDVDKFMPSDATRTPWHPYYCEIIPSGVTKSTALNWICTNIFNCTLNNCVSIGDSPVDVPMLQDCGLSFAPSNAGPEAKAAAKRVLPWSNDESCVGKIINEIFFDNKFSP